MKLSVVDINGKDTGRTVELKKEIFAINPSKQAVYLSVRQYLANQRQGTHKAKDRGEVKYSTRKIKKQKGTGTARAGSLRSGVFVGGGRIFGPQPRDYSFKLNKKVKRLARLSVLSDRAKENKITIIENFSLEAPKTKKMLEISENVKQGARRYLFVLPEGDKNIYLSARNLQHISVKPVTELNAYELMRATELIFTESSIDYINKQY